MDIGYAVVKGIVQGLTEFLPVSSTAHLVFTDALAKVFHWDMGSSTAIEEEFFNVLVQVGTLWAVIWYFRRDLLALWQDFTKKPLPEGYVNLFEGIMPLERVPLYLMVSLICTIVMTLGVLKGSEVLCTQMGLEKIGIHDISEFFFHYPQLVAFHLIVTGVLLFFTQRMSDQKLAINDGKSVPFTMHHAIAVGIFQAIAAIFHGVSRSGSTISAGLATGLDRVTATRYSFLLSLPTFAAATAYEVLKLHKFGAVNNVNWTALLIGMGVAAVVGYYCVKYFLWFLGRNRLTPFIIYCWAMGALMFIFLSINGQPIVTTP